MIEPELVMHYMVYFFHGIYIRIIHPPLVRTNSAIVLHCIGHKAKIHSFGEAIDDISF